jgi:hypothetical protein
MTGIGFCRETEYFPPQVGKKLDFFCCKRPSRTLYWLTLDTVDWPWCHSLTCSVNGGPVMKHICLVLALAVCVGAAASPAPATVLIFQPAMGQFGDNSPLPAGYGYRVEAEVQDGFLYGLDGGPTPNVTTYYNDGGDFPVLATWSDDFGDLHHVVYAQEPRVFLLGLVADDGFVVTLNSFDMAAWPHLDITINSVAVYDQDGNALLYQASVLIYGAPMGPQHTHFDFTDCPLTGNILYIVYDSTNYDSDDIGITNINFGQDITPGS